MEKAWELAALDMTEKDEIEVSVGADGAKIVLKGGVASRAGSGLADLFKPFVQWVGEKGDAIAHERNLRNQVRIFNEDALRKGLLRAVEIASERDIAVQPVPLKFLAQWSEGVSLEDVENSGSLTDLWAELLFNASQKFSSGHLLYSRILREMTISEALVLKNMIMNPLGNYQGNRLAHCEEAILHWGTVFGNGNWFDPDENETDVNVIINAAMKQLERPGTMAEGLIFSRRLKDGGEEYWERNNKYLEDNNVVRSMNLLSSLNLVKRMEGQGLFRRLGLGMFGLGYSMTPMAADFSRACGVTNMELK